VRALRQACDNAQVFARDHGLLEAGAVRAMTSDPFDLQRRSRLLELFNTPRARFLPDTPGAAQLALLALLDPHDESIRETIALSVQGQLLRNMNDTCPFLDSRPPLGALPPHLLPQHLPLGFLPDGGLLQLPIAPGANLHSILEGPSGSGKTNQLRWQLAALSCFPNVTTIAFDRKGDLTACSTLNAPGARVLELRESDLQLSLLQPPLGMSVEEYAVVFVEAIADALSHKHARRYILETLQATYREHASAGRSGYPTLRDLLRVMSRTRAHESSRLGGFRDAVSYALKSLISQLGATIEYAKSDFLAQVLCFDGVVVIHTGRYSLEAASVLAVTVLLQAFEARRRNQSLTQRHLRLCFDDALPLATSSAHQEAQEGMRPLPAWSLVTRSFNMSFCVASQSYAHLSPALRANTSTLVCTGASGSNVREVTSVLGLTQEQSALLRVLQVGEAVVYARNIWPQPVLLRIPLVA
jgi:hypothetical protein